MIEKYFIGLSAKSKGFIKNFNTQYYDNTQNTLLSRECNPNLSFTKQHALALDFNTKEETIEAINQNKERTESIIAIGNNLIENINILKNKWDDLHFNDKVLVLHKIVGDSFYTNRYGKIVLKHFNGDYLTYDDTYHVSSINNLSNVDMKILYEELLKNIKELTDYRKMLDTLIVYKEKLVLKNLPIKMINLRVVQSDNSNTNKIYCNKCGYAVPNMSYINLRYVTICDICLNKMAKESSERLARIPKDIIDHYENDIFIQNL